MTFGSYKCIIIGLSFLFWFNLKYIDELNKYELMKCIYKI